jgi:hypothetical protein
MHPSTGCSMIKENKLEFDFKDLLYVSGIVAGLATTWGVFSQKVEAIGVKQKEQAPMGAQVAELKGLILGVQSEQHEMHQDLRDLSFRVSRLQSDRPGQQASLGLRFPPPQSAVR